MTSQIAMLPTAWRWIVLVLLFESSVSCWVFVALYTKSWRWWRNELGSHLVAFSICLGLFLTYYDVLVIWPALPGRTAIRMVLFIVLAAVINWRMVLFLRLSRAEKSEREASGGPPS